MKTVWWLIQINAVVCFYLFYLVATSEATTPVKSVAFVLLIVAALLEHFAYRRIYKPLKQRK